MDQTFTPQTGIQVKISVMPDANKLMASRDNTGVALGQVMPFTCNYSYD